MHNPTARAQVFMNLSAFFSGMVFYAPVETLYRQDRGITIWQMSIIGAVSLFLMMALEILWGYVADRIGYRRTLAVSFSLLFISKIAFFCATGFPLFLIERILLAIAFSALSGVDIACLHSYKAGQKELGHYQGSMFLGLLVVALVFLLFTEIFVQSAFLTIACHLFALSFILLLPREKRGEVEGAHPKANLQETIGALAKNRKVLSFVIGNTLLFGINQMVTIILVQLLYARVGIPLSMFGLSFLLLVVSSSLCSCLSAALSARLGGLPLTAFAFMLSVVGFLLLSTLGGVAVVLLGSVMIRMGATLVQPLYFSVTAKASEGRALATSLSINSLLGTCIEFFLTLGLGFLAEKSLALSLQIAIGLLILALGSIYSSRSLLTES